MYPILNTVHSTKHIDIDHHVVLVTANLALLLSLQVSVFYVFVDYCSAVACSYVS